MRKADTMNPVRDLLDLENLRSQALAGMGRVLAEKLSEFMDRNTGVKPDPLQLQEMLKVALDDAVLVGRGETATSSAEARAALLLLISLSNVSTRIFEAPRSSVVEDRWLSTEDVARILNASRPYVVKLADAGRLGDVQRTEGGQRRILATAVEIYRNERKTQSRKALEELSAISQEVSSPGSRRNESNLPDSSND